MGPIWAFVMEIAISLESVFDFGKKDCRVENNTQDRVNDFELLSRLGSGD